VRITTRTSHGGARVVSGAGYATDSARVPGERRGDGRGGSVIPPGPAPLCTENPYGCLN
jgi:hypothetical protein